MTYIILAAGAGKKLHPLTFKTPKSLYKLDKDTTVLQRMIKLIREYDPSAEIVVASGFMHDTLKKEIENENVILVRNPFYSITNSISSLWFARDYLLRNNVTIIDGDIVTSEKLVKEIICSETKRPYVAIDKSLANGDKYYVQIQGDKVCVMSKQLSNYYGQYSCIVKLDGISSRLLFETIDNMINDEMYDLYFEDALVSMIFSSDFELYYEDISAYQHVEIDTVDDLLVAKTIQKTNNGD